MIFCIEALNNLISFNRCLNEVLCCFKLEVLLFDTERRQRYSKSLADHSGTVEQRLTVNVMVVSLIPTWGDDYILFPRFGI